MRSVILACLFVGITGCYASEKLGKDVQDTSHDVRESGITMKNGALGVYRTTELTSAEVPAAPAPIGGPVPEAALPRKEDAPASLFPQAELPSAQGNRDLSNAPIIPPPAGADAGTFAM
ncbi:MAG: hypothetical protein JWP97_2413 [Labilithrix sp.]|nr:hypothetical protein [Labilithrix sp.]